jgi:hypothetical protein
VVGDSQHPLPEGTRAYHPVWGWLDSAGKPLSTPDSDNELRAELRRRGFVAVSLTQVKLIENPLYRVELDTTDPLYVTMRHFEDPI